MRWTLSAIGSILEGASKPGLTRQSERRFAMPATIAAKDHIYKILELVGSSDKSIENAIQNAVTRASKTIREMKWFEVLETRGHIEGGKVAHYQVTLRVGFTLEE
jgi:flavin-binding protein dodecin